MHEDIFNAYRDGRLMLLLGAGASDGSLSYDGKKLPLGRELAIELAMMMNWDYNGEALSKVYSAINNINSAKLHGYFRDRFSNARPSADLLELVKFPWPRIFTLNIDDCIENALRKSGVQNFGVFLRNSPLEEVDPIFSKVQVVKLNGSADRPEDGFIFSPQEYGDGANRLPIWYRELGQSYSNYSFVFIGTKLDEPLFQHALAEMRSTINRSPLRGFVITPEASIIDKHHLSGLNLEHIAGTISDFVSWLNSKMPTRPTGWEIAISRRPELRSLDKSLSRSQKYTLNSITLVSGDTLPRSDARKSMGAIREFYRGFKPKWEDVQDGIPAKLAFIDKFIELVLSNAQSGKCIALVGPAGSGKSTALMMTALDISRKQAAPVYYLKEPSINLKDIIRSLEQLNDSMYYLFIDKVEGMHLEISDFLRDEGRTCKVCFVITERLNIWKRRVESVIAPYVAKFNVIEKITRADATLILDKLEKFGPWTRLRSMPPISRIEEIYNKADRQLLIGLMEATTGVGFTQIIRKDFNDIGDVAHKAFLVIVGLASIHRSTMSPRIAGCALANLGIAKDINIMSRETEGIVVSSTKKLSARHPLYVRELFEKIVSTTLIRDCLKAVLEAFSDYDAPVIKNIGKADGAVFKSIINHRFIKKMMRNEEDNILSIYKAFETKFHVDGLYWLQYGLSLRDFDRHEQALDIFRTTRDAYKSPQIDHAYAQQLLIMASRSTSWDDAKKLLDEAMIILNDLEQKAEDSDEYPIVTLAEGHISVMKTFFGTEGVRDLAQSYANKLLIVQRRNSNDRLREAIAKVVKFATNGIWENAYGFDEDSF